MILIHHALESCASDLPQIRLTIERTTLAKRRWRAVAEDGVEFGYDGAAPLPDGAFIFASETAVYVLAQKYEPVLEVALEAAPAAAARLGWLIGNLHFTLEILPETLRVIDDSAIRQLLLREGVAFTACKRVFHPLGGGHQH